ncbi:glycosyltransferase [Micromonospora sp. AMSO31t]|uniref:glycosyltransferase n=1 Tax=Micromonospora sp. AMSO31t TaxID=2650566 RepID=UPI001CECBD4E|nr:glycosyltransferase [Micromonospora sp. AMSO31t]
MPATSERDVVVITPWFPTRELPFRGSFVQAMVDATAPGCDRMTVYHCDAWVAALDAAAERRVREAHHALLARSLHRTPTVGGADLVFLPVPVPRGLGHAEIAERHDEALRAALGGRPIEAPVVHAHVGLPSGWAAVRNAGPDTRVFVTEHASFLDKVLETPRGREMYDEVLHRCAGFLAVGDGVRRPLVEAFPHHAERIGAISNPISFDQSRPEPITELRRWLFVGALSELKGVPLLLEAFARCRSQDPSLTLTLVGEGTLLASLTARAAELGVADAVTFTGAVPPHEALRLMREHDLLVHPSRKETFGVAVLEGIAAGLPVLVTRCGGPERTLAGIEEAAGVMIDVTDDPDTIVAGYQQLRSRFPAGLDPALVRKVLSARYGYAAVADTHHRLWFSDEAAPSA